MKEGLLTGVVDSRTSRRTRTRTIMSKMTAEYVRLPEAKERCEVTGMSRSWVLERIRESQAGEHPIRSFHVRQPGAARGVVLIDRASLVAHVESYPAPCWGKSGETTDLQMTDGRVS